MRTKHFELEIQPVPGIVTKQTSIPDPAFIRLGEAMTGKIFCQHEINSRANGVEQVINEMSVVGVIVLFLVRIFAEEEINEEELDYIDISIPSLPSPKLAEMIKMSKETGTFQQKIHILKSIYEMLISSGLKTDILVQIPDNIEIGDEQLVKDIQDLLLSLWTKALDVYGHSDNLNFPLNYSLGTL